MIQDVGSRPSVVRVVSDTHGLLRPEVVAALSGADTIIHAGDLGSSEIHDRLSEIAPTHAIRGNVDRGAWADAIPETLTFLVAGVRFHVLHDVNTLGFDPADGKISVVVSGHSHRPVVREQDGVLYLNPGSAGPRRFTLPVTVARLEITPDALRVEIIDVLENVPLAVLAVDRRKRQRNS